MRFEYLKPKTIQEAVSLLKQHTGKAKVLAGGTDLMVQVRAGMTMQEPKEKPQYVIDIESIPGFADINYDEKDGLKIGPVAKIRALEKSSLLHQRYPVIAQAASQLGSVAIRNVATVGGNICNGVPSAETLPALIGLGAKGKIAGPAGERVVPLEEFFVSSGKTVVKADELLIEIQVPKLSANTKAAYLKCGKRWGTFDLAIVNVAAILTMDSDGKTCRDAKIVVGNVASTPMRARSAEDILKGNKIDDALIEKAAQAASDQANPRSGSIRASAEYKKAMVKVFVKRAVKQALAG